MKRERLALVVVSILLFVSNMFWITRTDDVIDESNAHRSQARYFHIIAQTNDKKVRSLQHEIAVMQKEIDTTKRLLKTAVDGLAEAEARERALLNSQRASRSRSVVGRQPMLKHKDIFQAAAAWANLPFSIKVANCESGGNPKAVNPTGKYRGKWQMDSNFWREYGGLEFASRPDLASEAQQDVVAYRGWLSRGWQPWSCA